ncbi:caspase domain-containing protein [Desarmillaria tabescens]|uniref:Caspase domain-containing protein n=1 Tax=Armillaria tabescens TaxID=1929756 RepID=A0AA39N2M4_ARMTA|nr:caspase domain-containing protein [Desarmillaria tabescens]KAK0455687.1 caspase domain-containing protein [Desarmillaria tabescens]
MPPRGRFGNAIHRIFRSETSKRDNVEGSHKPCSLRESLSMNRGARHRIDASRFWAVLIGINAYERTPLRGCVSDALLVKSFLINTLGVPEERIQCLLGCQNSIPSDPFTPYRANIVEVLYSLINRREIDPGDNIFIYYAGYGSCYCRDDHFYKSTCDSIGNFCLTKALCPLDRDTQDHDGKWVPDISDRELDAIFAEISRVKGHKITFIADCYYARNFCRCIEYDGSLKRSVWPTYHSDVNDMLRAGHERLDHLPRYRSILSDDWRPDMSSHVTLTACQEGQVAKEMPGKKVYGGVFTKTLVRVLKSGAWKKKITYVELNELLDQSYFQTPVVTGGHKNERVWYQV